MSNNAKTRVRIAPHQWLTAKKLLIAASVCLLSIAGLYALTESAASASEKRYLVQSLAKTLPENAFDNNLLATQTQYNDITIYQACQATIPRYAIYQIQTSKGYSGLIKLLVAIDLENQRIVQVRTLFHQETPGLGDQIEVNKSDWLQQFQRPLSTPSQHIAIKADSGQIDAITRATITSRAVSNVIQQQLFINTPPALPNLCEQNDEKH